MRKFIGSIVFLVSGFAATACGSSGGAPFTSSGSGGNGTGGAGSSTGGSSGSGTTAGSGGTNASGGSASGGSAGASGGSAGASGGGASGGSAGAGGGSAGAGGSGGSGIAGSAAGGSGGSAGGNNPPCPVPTGYYETITTQGAGCGDLATDTPACASAGNEVCHYVLKSGQPKSVSGTISLQPDGAFANAGITEGTAQRSGCKGTDSGDTLTIICGGTDVGSSQYCATTLTRTAATCP
jgi:hypothetical protein